MARLPNTKHELRVTSWAWDDPGHCAVMLSAWVEGVNDGEIELAVGRTNKTAISKAIRRTKSILAELESMQEQVK